MQNEALAAKAYANPFGFAVEYGLDTLPRQALQRAQDEAQVSLYFLPWDNIYFLYSS